MNLDYEKHKKIIILIFYIVLAIAGVFLLFTKVFPVILPFIAAFIFAYLINPVVNFLSVRIKMGRKISSVIAILLVFAIVISLVVIAAGEIYQFAQSLISDFLTTAKIEELSIISDTIYKIFRIEIDLVNMVKNLVTPIAQGLVSVIKSVATNVPKAFIASVIFILATYVMVVDKDKILNFFKRLIGEKNAKWLNETRKISKHSILQYIKAQLTIMTITFSELLLGFTVLELIGIIDLKFMFLISFLIALLDALPVFGTGAVLIPWCIYNVILGRFDLAVSLLILYIICLVVRQFVEPKIVGEKLGLHPLVTLIAMYSGLKLMGIFGMILFPVLTLFIIQFEKAGAFDFIKNIFKKEEI